MNGWAWAGIGAAAWLAAVVLIVRVLARSGRMIEEMDRNHDG